MTIRPRAKSAALSRDERRQVLRVFLMLSTMFIIRAIFGA